MTALTQSEQAHAERILLQQSIDSLAISVKELSGQMAEHFIRQEPLETLVKKHEIQLNGDGDNRLGLVTNFVALNDIVRKHLSRIEKAVWIIVAALLAGFGATIWQVLNNGIWTMRP